MNTPRNHRFHLRMDRKWKWISFLPLISRSFVSLLCISRLRFYFDSRSIPNVLWTLGTYLFCSGRLNFGALFLDVQGLMDGAEHSLDHRETTGAIGTTSGANEFQPFDGNQIASLQSQLLLLQGRVKVWPSTLISTSAWLMSVTKWRSIGRAMTDVRS